MFCKTFLGGNKNCTFVFSPRESLLCRTKFNLNWNVCLFVFQNPSSSVKWVVFKHGLKLFWCHLTRAFSSRCFLNLLNYLWQTANCTFCGCFPATVFSQSLSYRSDLSRPWLIINRFSHLSYNSLHLPSQPRFSIGFFFVNYSPHLAYNLKSKAFTDNLILCWD